MPRVNLLSRSGAVEPYTMQGARSWKPPARPEFNRVAFSAAHVVADARSAVDPWIGAAVDWDATLRYREHLLSLGLGIAEAMDTAQRGMGLDWPTALELIKRTVALAKGKPGAKVASGVGTDQLAPRPGLTTADVIAAYEEQAEAVESVGGRIILMASRALAASARSADDYEHAYGAILGRVREPVILHWLGPMFDPALAGYWGSDDLDEAMDVCLRIIGDHAAKVDGIKISLLDKDKEIDMRRRLPEGVKMYTGDDFNYPELIEGDDRGYSHALLGIFDAIAPAASAGLQALGANDLGEYRRILEPTVPLSRHIFAAPTRFYKSGVVFLAWLNGWQDHFVMVGGQQSARSALHYSELFRLADAAGLLDDPDRAASRMRSFMAVQGIEP
ncbi:dihydrodipicolinate synthase family protein [Paludisphaera rhizosphaerae]|uniref:dihydrodipicolinate synthase family protein n=1 Tax=Paludisphaera rhizosphaerae TaxID=2711216 RepID=UPI0013EA5E3F|nr:dihydrodipicolinate synthase family protein [Paludisphaera rhizosphaerae]